MRVKIEVTEKDIRLGRRQASSTTKCPVARALKRVFKSRFRICEVSFATLEDAVITLPREAGLFMYALEGGKSVKPFSFTITAPVA